MRITKIILPDKMFFPGWCDTQLGNIKTSVCIESLIWVLQLSSNLLWPPPPQLILIYHGLFLWESFLDSQGVAIANAKHQHIWETGVTCQQCVRLHSAHSVIARKPAIGLRKFKCTVNLTFDLANPEYGNTCRIFFRGCTGPYFGPTNTIYTKNYQKNTRGPIFKKTT